MVVRRPIADRNSRDLLPVGLFGHAFYRETCSQNVVSCSIDDDDDVLFPTSCDCSNKFETSIDLLKRLRESKVLDFCIVKG